LQILKWAEKTCQWQTLQLIAPVSQRQNRIITITTFWSFNETHLVPFISMTEHNIVKVKATALLLLSNGVKIDTRLLKFQPFILTSQLNIYIRSNLTAFNLFYWGQYKKTFL
jgi:hypothetical protein